MKHLTTYSIFESNENPWALPLSPLKQDLGEELKHVINDTQEGKDLLAVTSMRFRNREQSEVVFTSTVTGLNNYRFAIVEPAFHRREKGVPLKWTLGLYPYDNPGPPYVHLGDFPTIGKCLRALWVEIVTMLCDEIFLDAYERQDHIELIRNRPELLTGHAWTLDDLRFLIPNLKSIATGDISGMDHATAAKLREKYPLVWKDIVDKHDPDSLGTFADLGDLGF